MFLARRILPWLAAGISGLLLYTAFPPLEWHESAWIALVPLILIARFVDPARALRMGVLAGFLFWLFSIQWLTRVTTGGMIALSMYCALFWGLFALCAARIMRWTGTGRWRPHFVLILVVPLVWVGLEFIRSTFLTGFPWHPLGVSQYRKIALIQIASWGGVYAVSYVVVLVNVAIALTINRYVEARGRVGRQPHPELIFGFLVLALVIASGYRSMRAAEPGGPTVRASLIQPNIPQYEKWSEEFVDHIYDRLYTLTQWSLVAGEADLVVWPETAVPDYIRSSERSYELVYKLAQQGAAILVGSMDVEWRDDGPPRYYNSSMLFDRNADLMATYDKQHLVIFGEYVPLDEYIPFMQAMTPIEASFDAGSTSTVFRMNQPDVAFSVLICFEDTVPRLSRRAVRNGARLLINQTNDAWFDPSIASWQHMTHSVFRAAENRVPLLRCANTGVSCAIDRFGRIRDLLADDRGRTAIAGFKTAEVRASREDMALTFYTRYGDIFAWTGVAALAVVCVGMYRERGGSHE